MVVLSDAPRRSPAKMAKKRTRGALWEELGLEKVFGGWEHLILTFL